MKLTAVVILSLVGIPCLGVSIMHSILSWMPNVYRVGLSYMNRQFRLAFIVGFICCIATCIISFTISWTSLIAVTVIWFIGVKAIVRILLFKIYPRGTRSGELAYLFYTKQISSHTFASPFSTGFPSSGSFSGSLDMYNALSKDRETALKIMQDDSLQ